MLSAVEKKSDQVYRWLLAYIDENKFSGNQRLPSENALCRKPAVDLIGFFLNSREHGQALLFSR